MKRSDLAPSLREMFRPGRPCGVERVDDPKFRNLWFVVPPAPPRHPPRKLPFEALARANRLLAALPRYDKADDLHKAVSFLFSRREAVQSSALEGTFSTVDAVLTPGGIHDVREGKSENASVRGYAHALETEHANAARVGVSVFSLPLVMRLHREITSKDPSFRGQPGGLREPGKPGSVVFIGGIRRREESVYNPAPARHVRRCLGEVLKWLADGELAELGDAGIGMTLPVRMAIGHSHFEAVHPFPDGNGRVGRMLLTLQMVAHGTLPLYLSGYIETERAEYAWALGEAQRKLRYGPIVEFISEAMVAAKREADQTIDVLTRLPEEWAARGRFRPHGAARRGLSFLLTHPIFTVKDLAASLKVSSPAAHRAVAGLVQAGVVRERTGFGRNRVFAAEEVIELISRPFGDAPTAALDRARRLLEGERL